MKGRLRNYALMLFVICASVMAMLKDSGVHWSNGFAPQQSVATPPPQATETGNRKGRAARANQGRFETWFASSRLHTQAHAATLVELKDGAMRAFWLSGSGASSADVTINSAVFDPLRNTWSEEQIVTGRDKTQRGLHRYIAKVGNPVVMRAPDDSLWLFYVTVSLGGWAGSSVTLVTSNDEGASWSAPRRLVTSPFMNVSTLVKGTPFHYADGSVGLPVYHEFIGKFAEILRLDRSGRVIDKQRLAAGWAETLQPVVLVRNEKEALALTRNSGRSEERRVMSIATEDGGQHWGRPQATGLKNPDAALTALVLDNGSMLAVLNDSENGRGSLSLHISADGGATWRELRRLEEMSALRGKSLQQTECRKLIEHLARDSDARLQRAPAQKLAGIVDSAGARVRAGGGCGFEFSFPYMVQARNGDIHVVYSWNRTFIKHLLLDQVWLQRRIRGERP